MMLSHPGERIAGLTERSRQNMLTRAVLPALAVLSLAAAPAFAATTTAPPSTTTTTSSNTTAPAPAKHAAKHMKKHSKKSAAAKPSAG
jgi:hypothetical protein